MGSRFHPLVEWAQRCEGNLLITSGRLLINFRQAGGAIGG